MSKKNNHRRNLITVEKLLSRIAKFAKDPEQRLKEAQSFIKSTFPKVQGNGHHRSVLPEICRSCADGLF